MSFQDNLKMSHIL